MPYRLFLWCVASTLGEVDSVLCAEDGGVKDSSGL